MSNNNNINFINGIIKNNKYFNSHENESNFQNRLDNLLINYNLKKQIVLHNIISKILNKFTIEEKEKKNILKIITKFSDSPSIIQMNTLIFIINKLKIFNHFDKDKDKDNDFKEAFDKIKEIKSYISVFIDGEKDNFNLEDYKKGKYLIDKESKDLYEIIGFTKYEDTNEDIFYIILFGRNTSDLVEDTNNQYKNDFLFVQKKDLYEYYSFYKNTNRISNNYPEFEKFKIDKALHSNMTNTSTGKKNKSGRTRIIKDEENKLSIYYDKKSDDLSAKYLELYDDFECRIRAKNKS
jgi:hypothetical protein